MKKSLCIIMALVLMLCFSSCTATPSDDGEQTSISQTDKEKFTKSFLELFDTASTIIAYDTSQESFDEHYQMFYDKLEEYDHLFDIYHFYEGVNNLYVVNRDAGKEPVKVSPEIISLLKYGKEIYELSGGNTNICFGSVLVLWHYAREDANNGVASKLPEMSELQAANEHTNIDDLIIDEENSTVFFNDPEMRLDVGSIAKGFAVQLITDWARENLWSSAAISIGGNVSTYGYKNDDGSTKWVIGIENPDTTAEDYLLTVKVTGVSVVTSGDYQRYFTVDGKKYCHIINPETLMPSEYFSSVSIICDDSALGDALSTTLFNMPLDEGMALVEKLDGVEAVWVDKEFNESYSSGFDAYINE